MTNNFTEAGYNNPSLVVESANAGTVVYPPGGKFGPRIQQDLQLVMLHTGSLEIDIDGIGHGTSLY